MKPHKHQEVIIAYANGAQVQYRDDPSQEWEDVDNPRFAPMSEYRVKPAEPEKAYPKSKQTDEELVSNYFGGGPVGKDQEYEAWRRIANAALRHACDNGQIVTREEFDRAVGDRAKRDVAVMDETIQLLNEWLKVDPKNVSQMQFGLADFHRAIIIDRVIKGVTQ